MTNKRDDFDAAAVAIMVRSECRTYDAALLRAEIAAAIRDAVATEREACEKALLAVSAEQMAKARASGTDRRDIHYFTYELLAEAYTAAAGVIHARGTMTEDTK